MRRTVRREGWSLVAALVVASLLPVTTSAATTGQNSASEEAGASENGGGVTLSASVEVTYTMPGSAGGGTSSGGGTTTQSRTVEVTSPCGYKPWFTGPEAEKFINSLDTNSSTRKIKTKMTSDDFYAEHKEHAEDEDGRWYRIACKYPGDPSDAGANTAEYQEYWKAASEFHKNNPDRVWVPSGETPPQPPVDPVVLARAVWKAVEVPPPSIDRNPKLGDAQATVVGLDTWVWATGQTPQTVTVQATLGTTSVTVTATSDGLRLQAPDAVSSCTGFGTAWQAGMAEGTSDCTIEFTRSSAHLGGTTPVTASVSYSATWTSTNGSSGTLDPATTTSTTNIPVTEIQTINVPTPDH